MRNKEYQFNVRIFIKKPKNEYEENVYGYEIAKNQSDALRELKNRFPDACYFKFLKKLPYIEGQTITQWTEGYY